MRVIALIQDPAVIERILARLGLWEPRSRLSRSSSRCRCLASSSSMLGTRTTLQPPRSLGVMANELRE
jgi:hypothetical protein